MYNPNNYPIDAYPSKLRDVIVALHEDTQFPVEMIGSTLLAAISLALQPLVEVASPYGTDSTEPCSLYFLTLAESGEGKGPVFDKIMSPFNAFVTEMRSEYEELNSSYKKDHATWSVIKKGLESSLQKVSRLGGDCEAEALVFREHLEKEPSPPRKFEIFNDDNSPVGLIEQLDRYPYAGCFASEAMTFFNGYLKSNQALLNKLWSNESYPYGRKGKSIHLTGCRLTTLLMTQPSEFEKYLQKQGARDLLNGFLARFLITKTHSTKENRKINLDQKRADESLSILYEVLNDLFHKQKEMFHDKTIKPTTINLSDEAKVLFKERIERFNINSSKYNKWAHISEFISKSGSQAIRIAAIFGYYNDCISKSHLSNAFTITEWHLNQTAEYFYESSEQFQLKQDVYALFDQIRKRFTRRGGHIKFADPYTGQLCFVEREPWQPFLKHEVNQYAPNRLRGENRWEPAFNQLISLGRIMTISYPPYSEIYVAMPGTDIYGNINPLNSPPAGFQINKIKNSTEVPLDGYDDSKLNWL